MKHLYTLLLVILTGSALNQPLAAAPDSFFDIFLESVSGPPYPQTPHAEGSQGYYDNGNYRISSFFDIFTELCTNPSVPGSQVPSTLKASDSGGGVGLNGIDSFFDIYLELNYTAPSSFFDIFLEFSAPPGNNPYIITNCGYTVPPDGSLVIGMSSAHQGGTTESTLKWQLLQPGWTFAQGTNVQTLPGGNGIRMQLAVNQAGPAPATAVLRGTMNGKTTIVPEPASVFILALGVSPFLRLRRQRR